MNIFGYITIGSMIILTILILMQTRGAELGAGLGGGAEVNTVRRGTDKSIHQLTIIMAIIFSASLLLGVLA
jgi:preprotein translocase subunit SecG